MFSRVRVFIKACKKANTCLNKIIEFSVTYALKLYEIMQTLMLNMFTF